MRLLHRRARSSRRPRCWPRRPQPTSEQVRAAHERQPLPLRRLPGHRARRAARRRGAGAADGQAAEDDASRWRAASRSAGCSSRTSRRPGRTTRELSVAGTRVARLTGPRRVSGAARYVSDVALPGMLHGVVLRSPHAHATVELDLDAARAVPGVHAVLSAGRRERQAGPQAALPERAGVRGRAGRRARCEDAEPRRARASRRSRRATSCSASSSTSRRRSPSSACRRIRSRTRRGDVEAGMAEADVIVEAEYAHLRAGAARARAALRRRAMAGRRAARAGSRRRASATRAQELARALRARARPRARHLRVHGRRLRRQAGRRRPRA